MKLNRQLPYGTVIGVYEYEPRAMFTQGNKFFDANGDLIDAGKNDEGQPEDDGPILEKDGELINGQHGYDDASSQASTQAGSEQVHDDEGQDEEGHVLVMDKTDEELDALAESGMTPLRNYAGQFGVKGVSKSEIIEELKQLRA